jgi:hypothetical protein
LHLDAVHRGRRLEEGADIELDVRDRTGGNYPLGQPERVRHQLESGHGRSEDAAEQDITATDGGNAALHGISRVVVVAAVAWLGFTSH